MSDRSRAMKAPRPNITSAQIKTCRRVAAVLLGIAGLCDPTLATAAEAKGGPAAPMMMHRAGEAAPAAPRRVVVERREIRQVAQGGPVVLRGTRPANPNPAPAPPGASGEGIGSTSGGPAGALPPGAGSDPTLDSSGLSPPGGVLLLGR